MSVTINHYNRKSHTGFRLVPTSMTLNDLERRNSFYFAFFQLALRVNYVTVVEDRRINVCKILSPSSSRPFLAKTNAHCSAVSLR